MKKAYNNLGIIYDTEGQYDRAIFYYQMAIDINPCDSAAWSNIGLAYAHKGLPKIALNAYERAIEYSPQMPEGYFNLASFFLH